MVVLDTNIVIDHLRTKNPQSRLEQFRANFPQDELAVSIVTIQELFEGESTRNEVEETFLLATLRGVRLVPYNIEVAQVAGKLARDLGRPIDFPDAAIAATAIANGARLATLNKKDFVGIKDLELL